MQKEATKDTRRIFLFKYKVIQNHLSYKSLELSQALSFCHAPGASLNTFPHNIITCSILPFPYFYSSKCTRRSKVQSNAIPFKHSVQISSG